MLLDDPLHVSETELRGRLDRVRAEMAKQKIATLAVYDSAQHDMTRMGELFYLTDFYAVGPCWLLLPLDGRPTLFVTPAWDAPRAQRRVPYMDVVAADARRVDACGGRIDRTSPAAGLADRRRRALGTRGGVVSTRSRR